MKMSKGSGQGFGPAASIPPWLQKQSFLHTELLRDKIKVQIECNDNLEIVPLNEYLFVIIKINRIVNAQKLCGIAFPEQQILLQSGHLDFVEWKSGVHQCLSRFTDQHLEGNKQPLNMFGLD
ncbi:hypothetical protein Q9966_011796 [Columba livia]|nr:hypothetical protein Q9966_011796 [Columba livia]